MRFIALSLTVIILISSLGPKTYANHNFPTYDEGAFTCRVDHQNIIEVSKDKTKSYGGFTDNFTKGDQLTIYYSLKKNSSRSLSSIQ